MQSNNDLPITSCISQQRLSHIWNVLSHNLKCGQYREFTNGCLIVSVFAAADEKIMKTASTYFRLKQNQQSQSNNNNNGCNEISPNNNQQGVDYMPPPRLSASSIPILQQHTLDDLKALAACLGENTGKWHVSHGQMMYNSVN